MDTGIISTRYARAIYEYVKGNGEEDNLYDSMAVLVQSFRDFPELTNIMINPTISSEKKIDVLETASGVKANKIGKNVVRMVVENGRASYMQTIALMYDQIYRKAKGKVIVRLKTAVPVSDEIKNALTKVIAKVTGDSVVFHSEINSDIIGGFILQVEDKRLDASVKEQLNQLKLDLVKQY